jgi:hypothetical protein
MKPISETHPSLTVIETASFPDFYDDHLNIEDVQKHTIDKTVLKDALVRHIIGSNLARSKVCEQPYGDSCGYCHKCTQNQKTIINTICEELGLEKK